jgi:DNA-binding response OmpR family regulator
MAKPPRILVVNDTQEILELFRAILEDTGYEVALLSYAPQELLEVQRINPDLIILDLVFGIERVGMQLLDKLKLKRETAAIPVIVCTAAIATLRENEGYLKAHGVAIVAKPFDLDVLLATIKESLAPSA